MSQIQARAAVIAEAMTWLRTPYHPGGKLKGVGTDCGQFPIAVYAAVGVIPPTDLGTYSQQWHLHRDEELYLGWVRKFAREIPREAARPGDFGVWRYGRLFSHGAIVIGPPAIIHAYVGIGVALDDMDTNEELKPGARKALFFTLWGGDLGR